MASMSVSGVVSGMDWESMIENVLESARQPAMVQVNKRTNLTNKKSLFEEMKVTMNSIQSSLSPLKLPSTYNAKEIEIERVDTTGSYKGVLTATVNGDAEINVHDLKVTQLATAQTNRSKQITASTLAGTLGGLESSKIYINAGGQEIGVDVYATDSLQSLKSRINTTLKTLSVPLGVTASVVDNRLILKSDYTGLGVASVSGTTKDKYDASGKTSLATIVTDKDSGQTVNISVDQTNLDSLVVRSGTTTYSQGTDYEVINNEIRWKQYEDTDNVKLGESVSAVYTMGQGDVFSKTLTRGSSDSDTVNFGFDVKDNGTIGSRLKVSSTKTTTDDDGEETTTTTEYTYGKDFVYSDGKIQWLEQASETIEPDSYTISFTKTTTTEYEVTSENNTSGVFDLDELSEAYKNISGSELATLTLTGSDGVTRTYIDPGDTSIFSMSSYYDEKEYQYGRDYVFRISDDGEGYSVEWLVADGDTLSNANAAVASYAAEKNISLAGYQTGLAYYDYFILNLSGSSETTSTASVTSSDTDKSLSTLFGDDVEITEDDYENLVVTDSDGTTYTYGTDFWINDSGEIEWAANPDADYTPAGPDAKAKYTVTYESFKPLTSSASYSNEDETAVTLKVDSGYGDINDTVLSYEQIKKQLAISDDATASEISETFAKYFTLTDSDGNTYTYGTDYTIAASSSDASDATAHNIVIKWTDTGTTPAYGDNLTLTYTGKGEGGGETFSISDAITRNNSDIVMGSPSYDEFDSGTVTINQGSRYFYEGYDFEIDKNDDGNVFINWKTGTDYEWYYPTSGQYTINLTTEDGTEKTYYANRDTQDTLDLREHGFSTVSGNGALTSITYDGTSYDLTSTETDDDGYTPTQLVNRNLGLDINAGTNGGVPVYNFDWVLPARTAREGLPAYGADISIDYEYNLNTFSITDTGDGVVDLLGLNDDVTEAQQAIMTLNGDEVKRDSNDIGEDYENELLKGVTIHLKGVGEVSMDISHDAEKAVESIQTFVDNYNDLMTWINTRMTESQVDEDTAATIDSDDFRMRWGLLHGNSLLRNTKSQMRSNVSQNFTFSFTKRTSSEEIYGSMSYNGLKTDSTLRLRIDSKYVDVPILTTDTLETIVEKINNSENSYMRNIFYDDDGNLLETPLLKASVEGDKLVITASDNQKITMSGSAAMNALKMNYTYKGVYQLGIATTSDDYGKSGELEFDTQKFMDALEDNPDEVQELMLMFASSMDSWCKSMLTSSETGGTTGTLTRQINDLDSQIKNIDEYLEKYQERIDRMEENLRSKYSAAEQRIASLSQQASAISAILQQLSGNNNSNSSSSSS